MIEFAEVWCEKCPEPTDRIVETSTGQHPLCKKHGSDLEFMLYSDNFNGVNGRSKVAPR